jgi:exodeoxyribonuclease VII large subunit
LIVFRKLQLYYPRTMTSEITSHAAPPNKVQGNVPELSVSELAFSLKKTLEDSYGRVRVRGELSRVTIPGSGHMYADIKDDSAVLNTICWKGTLSKLEIKPEEGLEVICTGRVTTYPARSNYQLVIESMSLAGEGALLKMLEERKKKLAQEGLFAAERKKKRPYLPDVIGIITSPTGAVIRDIMHRLQDRFPRRVLLWPVLVQGDGAAEQITAALKGFDQLDPNDKTAPRPDLIILARGGGSLEDLMAFNDEMLVRAIADCTIPVISAIGHETDTTLADFAADLRAPTPTGAAEMAVPVRSEVMANVIEHEKRLLNSLTRALREKKSTLETRVAQLIDPARMIELKTQKLDSFCGFLVQAYAKNLSGKESRLDKSGARLRHPKQILTDCTKNLERAANSLNRHKGRLLEPHTRKLEYTARMLETLSFKKTLARGFVVVRDDKGKPVTNAEKLKPSQNIILEFKNDKKLAAKIDKKETSSKKPDSTDQGKLL